MPRFVYKAKRGPQESTEGIIEADTERAAVYKITQMGYFPVEVKQELLQETFGKGRGNAPFFYFREKVGWRDLSIFTRQIADLLGSGLTILGALDVLSRQTNNPRFKAVIDDVHSFIRDGGTFSGGLGRHPAIFSGIYTSLIKAGEAGGMLEEVLNRLADYAEAEDQLRSKVRSALAYPALMTIVGVGTITVLLTFVIPRLVTIFEDMGQTLPIPTLILIRMSGFVRYYGWTILAAIVAAIFLLNRRGKTKEGRLLIDNFKIKIFGVGPLIVKIEIARFTRTLGTLLTNGVPMVCALAVSGSTVENEVLRRDIERITKDVTEGLSFSKAMLKSSKIPLFAANMITVGDESGYLEKALLKVAESCERDVDRTVRVFTALLEPFIILIMGGIVGFIVISMLLPIFQINLMAR